MRASDLLGLDVIDRTGQRLGFVIDIRCVQDGPLRGSMSMLRVDALVVSRWRTGSLLGYNRREQQGPWLVRVIVRQLHRRLTIIKWSAVEGYVGHITLNRTARELDSHR